MHSGRFWRMDTIKAEPIEDLHAGNYTPSAHQPNFATIQMTGFLPTATGVGSGSLTASQSDAGQCTRLLVLRGCSI
jgi:hypothetical protein